MNALLSLLKRLRSFSPSCTCLTMCCGETVSERTLGTGQKIKRDGMWGSGKTKAEEGWATRLLTLPLGWVMLFLVLARDGL